VEVDHFPHWLGLRKAGAETFGCADRAQTPPRYHHRTAQSFASLCLRVRKLDEEERCSTISRPPRPFTSDHGWPILDAKPCCGWPMAQAFADRFRIEPGTRTNLGRHDPADISAFPNRASAEVQSAKDGAIINQLQDRLYAEGRRALLVVLQGTDTSGKDGTILHVFSDTGPRGVIVTAFRRPSEEELAHDFLWRAHLACPRRGYVGIFNRSHYEDVLAVRARKLVPREVVEQRYEQINAFEKMLSENGTTIVKFMLHISKKEQRERLQARLDDPKSRWKFDPGDLGDRKLWDEYQSAYEIMLNKCSTRWAPWHVVPADRKWARNAAVAAIVRETLEAMNPKYPKPGWNSRDFKVE
jgi:PPK2 family polyphosphate:nucleotide phosphotransferase